MLWPYFFLSVSLWSTPIVLRWQSEVERVSQPHSDQRAEQCDPLLILETMHHSPLNSWWSCILQTTQHTTNNRTTQQHQLQVRFKIFIINCDKKVLTINISHLSTPLLFHRECRCRVGLLHKLSAKDNSTTITVN